MQKMTMLKIFMVSLASILSFNSSSSSKDIASTSAQIKAEHASEYFAVYAARKDFKRFMAFYAEDAELQDVVYGYHAHNKTEIAAFYDWNRGQFSVLTAGPILQVTRQVISGLQVITEGQFNQFQFNGQTLGPWEFIIWQEYSEQGLVQKQTDWINYSPKKILITP